MSDYDIEQCGNCGSDDVVNGFSTSGLNGPYIDDGELVYRQTRSYRTICYECSAEKVHYREERFIKTPLNTVSEWDEVTTND